MADVKGTTAIHGNHGYIMFDGNIVGRLKNITMTVEGSADEFYEVGSAWVQDIEVINRKVMVEIEKGAVDFEALAYAVGAQATLDLAGGTTSFKELAGGTTQFNLITDEGASNVISVSNGNTQILSAPFVVDIVLAANKIVSPTEVVTYFVTAQGCKITRQGLSAPLSAYWTSNMSAVGKGIAIGGITHSIV